MISPKHSIASRSISSILTPKALIELILVCLEDPREYIPLQPSFGERVVAPDWFHAKREEIRAAAEARWGRSEVLTAMLAFAFEVVNVKVQGATYRLTGERI